MSAMLRLVAIVTALAPPGAAHKAITTREGENANAQDKKVGAFISKEGTVLPERISGPEGQATSANSGISLMRSEASSKSGSEVPVKPHSYDGQKYLTARAKMSAGLKELENKRLDSTSLNEERKEERQDGRKKERKKERTEERKSEHKDDHKEERKEEHKEKQQEERKDERSKESVQKAKAREQSEGKAEEVDQGDLNEDGVDVNAMPPEPDSDTEPWMIRPTPTPEEKNIEKANEMNIDWKEVDPKEFPNHDQDASLSVLEEDAKTKEEGRKVRRIRTKIDGEVMCLTEAPNGYMKAMKCEPGSKRQKWYFYKGGLKNLASLHMCLSFDKKGRRSGFLHMNRPCADRSKAQQWTADGRSGRLMNQHDPRCISMQKEDRYYVKLSTCPERGPSE